MTGCEGLTKVTPYQESARQSEALTCRLRRKRILAPGVCAVELEPTRGRNRAAPQAVPKPGASSPLPGCLDPCSLGAQRHAARDAESEGTREPIHRSIGRGQPRGGAEVD
jgi:hypothetical protein